MRGDTATTGRLVICATPIGNIEDVRPRGFAHLRGADLRACERGLEV
jgi:16S rRNA C1402 (ribose-2'-O) methylase RsmI